MTNACPIPTPAQQAYGKIQERRKAEMMRTIDAALRHATEQAQAEIEAAGLDMPAPPHGYFVATAHQHLFCILCDANPETFAGGRADTALAVIRNSQNVARHYWGADTDPAVSRAAEH